MPNCQLDHIAITATSLEAGADLVHEALGVRPLPGGEHPRMGTHNLLLRLGESVYLEVIAINPAASSSIGRPRWFGLDSLALDAASRLATWIARTDDIQASLAACSEPLGKVEPMSRGALNWQITVPEDGSLSLGGLAPALIQWEPGAHPASRMPDLGLSLTKLKFFHSEPERVTAMLQSLGMPGTDGLIEVACLSGGQSPYLAAYIDTPSGPRILSGAIL
ncbi:VOC family protein [Undibacterium terreum]|uniref:Polyphosphate kinase n=1 Tax=Undibacterium terreum TaxID=1224302 RepID=A0A916U9R8_9BURK|nr:VOC family protein [Undibacterium terreum]GGC63274.1 polyphosphate kinase [Undibacterium terreum]